MKNRILFLIAAFAAIFNSHAQNETETKVILITLDGFRWQELFTGADSLLIDNKDYVHNAEMLKEAFWRDTPKERREALLPFIWGQVEKMGQIHGNRKLGSKVNLTNSMWFSYPGYNEILTGTADDGNIRSNDKIPNPNITVLERYNNTPEGKGKVAAFGSWDVFPFIINEERSGIPVNAGFEAATENLNERERFLNQLQEQIPSPWGSVRLDAFTHHYALEHMKKEHPKLVYISYGETDDFAHDGDYQAYLKSANNTDGLIEEIWEFTRQDEFYKDQTVFLITTDHGRGTQPLDTWRSHGSDIKGAGAVWMIAFGKGIKPKGEIDREEQLYSNQLAPTILQYMRIPFPKGINRIPMKL
ncbi:phosphoglyceromutase [Flagellimonas halotolerans]|uniref:Phosphoglyceromutase n=1 Tax=Flagellimonas halotolerans TaxID=3112164 RepID=A0ABU6IPX0_9FLAO|nr:MULTISPECIES: phosphoglyceromutase [unclassified Allomuricauda]MEC3965285.1 phosphoglyceromutase [Muricauda sp. SYSU M86414]MEC4265151.1 phosphoglyceromutase [Muricauda sp. SYSU M84420]